MKQLLALLDNIIAEQHKIVDELKSSIDSINAEIQKLERQEEKHLHTKRNIERFEHTYPDVSRYPAFESYTCD